MRSSKIDGFGRDRSLICCGLLLDRFGFRGFRDRFESGRDFWIFNAGVICMGIGCQNCVVEHGRLV